MALNGTVLDCEPHEIATLMTAVLLAGGLPVVFWASRAVIGYSGGVSVIITGLFGISPIAWYAVAHVSPGQLLAAQAVSLLTWAGVSLWRGRLGWRRARQFIGVLALGYWLLRLAEAEKTKLLKWVGRGVSWILLLGSLCGLFCGRCGNKSGGMGCPYSGSMSAPPLPQGQ